MPSGSFVLTDAFVSINAVDLSDHVKQVRIRYGSELQEDTAMGDTTKSNAGGLLDWEAEVEFFQDYASSKVDATIFPLIGVATAVKFRPDKSDGVGATNPDFSGTGVIENYEPLRGSVGEMTMTTITIKPGGATPTLTRALS